PLSSASAGPVTAIAMAPAVAATASATADPRIRTGISPQLVQSMSVDIDAHRSDVPVHKAIPRAVRPRARGQARTHSSASGRGRGTGSADCLAGEKRLTGVLR